MRNILACVTFYFVQSRLSYLLQTVRGLRAAGVGKIVICTNAVSRELEELKFSCHSFTEIAVVSIQTLAHPYQLAMYHRAVFEHCYNTDDSVTHFLYSEDDHLFSKTNINYWFEAFDELRDAGDFGIPAWFRIEKRHADQSWVSVDYPGDIPLEASRMRHHGQNFYLDSIRPYAGAYMLDRVLMQEFIQSPDYLHIPPPPMDSSYYAVREHAAFGMVQTGLPPDSLSRYRIRLNQHLDLIDPAAYIIHLPNNYADTDLWPFRKLSEFNFLKHNVSASTK